MGPPPDSAAMPPAPPGPPGGRGFPIDPGGGAPPSRWTWRRWLVIAGAVVVTGLVIAAVVLATRKPASSPTTTALATPSASASASPSASPSPTPTAAPTPTAGPTPTATPTATPTPQNTPTQQAQLLFPSTGPECGSNGTYTGCPVTADLVSNANRWRTHNPSVPEPLCRCASTYTSAFAQQNDTLLPPGDQGNPARAAVQVSLNLSSGSESMVVLLTRQGGAWLAYDTYCDTRLNALSTSSPTTC